MSGFVPFGFVRLLDLVAEHGADFMGRRLASGQFTASMIDPTTGRMTGFARPNFFRLAGAEEIIRTGQKDGREIFVATRQVSQALHSIRNAQRPTPELVVDNTVRHSGGRPPKYDWEGALIELARLDGETGIGSMSQADLVRHLHQWFIASGQDDPSDSDIKKRVKRYQDTVWPKT
ncbi:hypothetical protein [Mesorhizobium sp.]|uniref:hypothetical protein n=1 Tax=Mesorhizobium sp. TaxID=1871066 RepID=UPI001204920A|nr:hypothetical protein [Mesorhizobium sp.]TIN77796.1 MAG: hypothetical protein E5Y09_16685 [Mesorhizobium sp.]